MNRTSLASPDALWSAIRDELDHWRAAGRTLRLWLRDDDAVAPTAQLDRLIALSERFDAPVLLAVIPMSASPALAQQLAGAPLLRPCQHGFNHRNHALPGKKAEFGPHRPLDVMMEELADGWRRLVDLFGARALAVFVPPWNRIDPALVAHLPGLGFRGLSSFRPKALPAPPGLATVSSNLDVIDWKAGRTGRTHETLIAELHAWLVAKRNGEADQATLGVLTHHLVHDETAWSFLNDLLTTLLPHPAVAMTDPSELFVRVSVTAAGTPR